MDFPHTKWKINAHPCHCDFLLVYHTDLPLCSRQALSWGRFLVTLVWWLLVTATSLRLAEKSLRSASPNETIIPSALETPMNDIETEAICTTVMRIFGEFCRSVGGTLLGSTLLCFIE